ncbi:MAG: RagB/SusD family nutrient uptake outer membrane protein [Bacteroidales bacterium]|nr:RagB/SusD family nutrient uptake outer membrane protein [Bacteroidales bacterium]MDD2424970.1 RagB/SusD family nutrient uptake outer membrane protein [Bacteroidales bacterium]MDD3989203.1 RagB/SusD family nutrient uptake outer membrane protein [Bacteroidales bacterium]
MKKYIYCILMSVLLTSCNKFLEEYSTDLRYCETAQDLEYLMIGEAFLNTPLSLSMYDQATMSNTYLVGLGNTYNYPWLHVMDDDSEVFVWDYVSTDQATPLYRFGGLHNWSNAPFMDVLSMKWDDSQWEKIYKRIGALNSIIFQAHQLFEKDKENLVMLQHICGEAYFLRAYYYFYLNNIYGMPYSIETASSDFGVPLKTSEVIEVKYFSRASNEEVYNQIISDLEQAATYLEGYTPDTKLRVGIAAVKALQSRVYLYTEQYEEAVDAAEEFDEYTYALIDLNTIAPNTNVTFRSSNETIFTVGANEIPAVFMNDSLSAWSGNDNRVSAFKASEDLMNKYQLGDLRLNTFFYKSTKNKAPLPSKYKTWTTYNDPEAVSAVFAIRYPEVLLNRAEALAMLGRTEDAREVIGQLRNKRFASALMSDVPATEEDLVNFIRDERRRELCFEGHRWFDLRRYFVNSKYPLDNNFVIHHPSYTYDGNSHMNFLTGYYELESYEKDNAGWIIPVPDNVIEFNRGEILNLERKTRNLINY